MNFRNLKKGHVLAFVAALSVVCALTSCVIKVPKKTKKAKIVENSTYLVEPFERIEMLGFFDVEYTQGDSISVRVESSVPISDKVVVTNDGPTLRLDMNNKVRLTNLMNGRNHIKFFITSPDLVAISLLGSGEFDARGKLDTDNLQITIAGSGDIEFDDIICDAVRAEVIGSGDIELKNVEAPSAQFRITGSGDIKAHLKDCGDVKAELTGSGDIKLDGNAKSMKKIKSGAGEISTDKLIVE